MFPSAAGWRLFIHSLYAIVEMMTHIKVIAPLLVAAAIMTQAGGRVGVCAHVTRDEFNNRIRTYEMMQDAASITSAATSIGITARKPRMVHLISRGMIVVDDAAKYGIKVLPIFHAFRGGRSR